MLEERRYSKRELARLYWPETRKIKSAMKNLREDIKRCPELVEELNRKVDKLRADLDEIRQKIKALDDVAES